ncbi:hypothetical protein [Isoptericola sp. NPDC056134]|uniref:hypothetical protein n=1 Tax=Isoptericola sp. NPDC056134 TaxID=3345723 RepID=UPI0035E7A23D
MNFWITIVTVLPVLALPITLNLRSELIRVIDSGPGALTIAITRAISLVMSAVTMIFAVYAIATAVEGGPAPSGSAAAFGENADVRLAACGVVSITAAAVLLDPAVTLIGIAIPSTGMPKPIRRRFRGVKAAVRALHKSQRRDLRTSRRWLDDQRRSLERQVTRYLHDVEAFERAGVFSTDRPTRPGEVESLLWVYRCRGLLMAGYRDLDFIAMESGARLEERAADVRGLQKELAEMVAQSQRKRRLRLTNLLPGAPVVEPSTAD